jgi:uncharacterized repeat protein (TIGR01451 family)
MKNLPKLTTTSLKHLFAFIKLLFASGLLAAALQAQESPLQTELKAFIVTAGERGDELTETEEVTPGQVVEYLLVFSNVSDQSLFDIKAIGIIPQETEVQVNSINQPVGLRAKFSIDDGQSFHTPPITYTVTEEDGRVIVKTATPDMYQQILWEIPSLPGQKAMRFTYRVRVK